MTGKVGFQAYLAINSLKGLRWKRRYLGLFGPRVTAFGAVIAQFKALFLMAAALGESRPELVRPILKASSGPGGDAYAFGLERTLKLMDAVGVGPMSYGQLFPDDAAALRDMDAWNERKVLPFDFAFMLAQVRVIEGLIFGEQYPDVTRQLLETEIREMSITQAEALAFGVDLGGAGWRHLEDLEQAAQEVATVWQSVEVG